MTLSGSLLKLGGGTLSHLQERDFCLTSSGTLDYFENGTPKGSIVIKGATIIDRGIYMGHHCFTIEGRNNMKEASKEYFLFAKSRDEKWKWVSALQRESGRYSFLEDEASGRVRLQSSALNTILARDGNAKCADCDAPIPSWAVVFGSASNTVNLGGIFVCIECIGIHRGLWPERCKEVVLDEWSGKEIEKMSQGGNIKVNRFLEFNTDQAVKPNRYSLRAVREKFIRLKYEMVDGTIVGSFSQDRHAAPGTDVLRDTATREEAEAAAANLPPRYMGVVLINVREASNFNVSNAVASFNNGYQEVKTMPAGSKGSSDGPRWNQMVQVGLDTIHRPLYATIFDGDKISGTAEVILANHFSDRDLCDMNRPNEITVSITGGGVSPCASLTLSVHLTRLA